MNSTKGNSGKKMEEEQLPFVYVIRNPRTGNYHNPKYRYSKGRNSLNEAKWYPKLGSARSACTGLQPNWEGSSEPKIYEIIKFQLVKTDDVTTWPKEHKIDKPI